MEAGRRTVGGTIGGALGAVPILSVARETAGRLWTPPVLPGALAEARDLKAATYLEAFVLLFLIPASAFFFGVILPQWLARRSGRGPLVRAAPGLAFGISSWLWRSGLGSGASLVLAFLAALTLAATGSRLGVYALPSMESREALAGIFLRVAAWTLACRCAGASFALWLLFVACGAAAALARLRSNFESWRPIA
jgi:hypothetical protein